MLKRTFSSQHFDNKQSNKFTLKSQKSNDSELKFTTLVHVTKVKKYSDIMIILAQKTGINALPTVQCKETPKCSLKLLLVFFSYRLSKDLNSICVNLKQYLVLKIFE